MERPAKRQRAEEPQLTARDVYFVRYGEWPVPEKAAPLSSANAASRNGAPPLLTAAALAQPVKLTPLETQVVLIKKQALATTIFFVACGYRMRLFGRDAVVAKRRLGLMCFPPGEKGAFESASVPLHRVNHHGSRLVAMGYRVAVVEQTESVAVRKEERGGRDGGGIFGRAVTAVWTRGTMVAPPAARGPSSGGGCAGAGDGADDGGDDAGDDAGDDNDTGDATAAASEGAAPLFIDQLGYRFLLFLAEFPARDAAEQNNSSDSNGKNNDNGGVETSVLLVSLVAGVAYVGTLRSPPGDLRRAALRLVLAASEPAEVVVVASPATRAPGASGPGVGGGLSAATEALLAAALPLNAGPTRDGAEDGGAVPFTAMPPDDDADAGDAAATDAADASAAAAHPALRLALRYVRPLGFGRDVCALPLRPLSEFVAVDDGTWEAGVGLAASQSQSRVVVKSEPGPVSDAGGSLPPQVKRMHLSASALACLDILRCDGGAVASAAAAGSGGARTAGSGKGGPTAGSSGGGFVGSLLWLCRHTRTAAGFRTLRGWAERPLADVSAIRARQAAVARLAADADARAAVASVLASVAGGGSGSAAVGGGGGGGGGAAPDLEAVLARLATGRCGPGEYVAFLHAVRRVARAAAAVPANVFDARDGDSDGDGAVSRLGPLWRALASPAAADAAQRLLTAVGGDAAAGAAPADAWRLFADADFRVASPAAPPALRALLSARRDALSALDAALAEARLALQQPRLEYKTVAGATHLIEVPTAMEGRAPKAWTVVSRTKAATRFQSPAAADGVVRLAANTDRIRACGAEAWLALQLAVWGGGPSAPLSAASLAFAAAAATSSETPAAASETGGEAPPSSSPFPSGAALRALFAGIAAALGEVDATASLAAVAQRPGYVRPRFHADPANRAFAVRGARHPMAEALASQSGVAYVPNDVRLGGGVRGGACLLTGPNMGGKSALMRTAALVAVMAQMGGFVPAEDAELPLFTSVHVRMGASDALVAGASTFLVEAQEAAAILSAQDLATSLVLIDELGRGTSSYDGAAVAAAALRFLIASRCTLFFVTHYTALCAPYVATHAGSDGANGDGAGEDAAAGRRFVRCQFMSFEQTDACGETGRRGVTFLFRAVDGVTPSSFGLNIAEAARVPPAVVAVAADRSAELERRSDAGAALRQLRAFVDSERTLI